MNPPKVNNDTVIGPRLLSGFSINAIMAEYLEELAKTGLYGASISDVARTLLYDAILRVVHHDEVIDRISHNSRHSPAKHQKAATEPEAAEESEESDQK